MFQSQEFILHEAINLVTKLDLSNPVLNHDSLFQLRNFSTAIVEHMGK